MRCARRVAWKYRGCYFMNMARLKQPPLLPRNALTQRQESFARCVAAGMSYAEAFRSAGLLASTAGSMGAQIHALKRVPAVAARILELKADNDRELVSTAAERMARLRLIAIADPDELSKVVCDPCGACWPDSEVAKAYAAHFAPCEFHDERPALPDPTKPRHDCRGCGGSGIARVVLTPTDELSPAGRALFKGAKQNDKGTIEIQTHDQIAALDMLNKMQSTYISRSMNLNVNAAVPAARDATPEDALRLFDAFGG